MTSPAGTQLSGAALHERQKGVRGRIDGTTARLRLVAYDVRISENIGSLLRLADAAGVAEFILVTDAARNLNLKRLHKAARNSEHLVPWRRITPAQFLDEAPALAPLIALEITDSSQNLFATDLPRDCTLLIGSESDGLPPSALAACVLAVHIPMLGVNGSMNVTQAAAVAVYEHRRRFMSA